MRLRVNREVMINEFRNVLIQELTSSKNRLIDEITREFKTEMARTNGEIKVEIENINNRVIMYIKANAEVLMDNYGTGSKMDIRNNPLIMDYISSDKWNKHRSLADTTIRGRDAGSYENVFGETAESSGRFARQNLEHRVIRSESGGYVVIEPKAPSYAIEVGTSWYFKEWIPDILARAVKKMNFSKAFTYE